MKLWIASLRMTPGSEVVELLFFGRLTYEETAAALDISPATVHRELRMARAWLLRELSQ
jgi:DNA-directed RNA polymerase specialized sigma24 family protein